MLKTRTSTLTFTTFLTDKLYLRSIPKAGDRGATTPLPAIPQVSPKKYYMLRFFGNSFGVAQRGWSCATFPAKKIKLLIEQCIRNEKKIK